MAQISCIILTVGSDIKCLKKLVESEAELVKNNSFSVCPVSSLLRTLSSLNIALLTTN